MIKDGAMAFLKEEYKWLSVFVVLLGGILCALFRWKISTRNWTVC